MVDLRTIGPSEFPALLREIPDAPHSLYIRGALPAPGHTLLSVVGSRRMSSYGKDACEHLIRGLSGYPISIVSGLALGIDGVAHRAALNAGLHTVAVLGSGLEDQALYPASHRALARAILEAGGALVSEEAPDFKPRPESFPKRNRIMAGMSHAVLVIEATLHSGTLVTARLASDYNRDVFTVPGSLFSENTEGPHLLLSLGATPVRSASDILQGLGFEEEMLPETGALTEDEARVHNALSEPRSRDELIRLLRLDTASANALLIGMELKGLIVERQGLVHKR